MDKGDRNPCLNPRCGRTFKREPGESEGCEVVCGKCWKTVPLHLRQRYKALRRRYRRIERLLRKKRAPVGMRQPEKQAWLVRRMLDRQIDGNWSLIRASILAAEQPQGLEQFLEENGLS